MSEEANQLYHYTSMNALFQILNGIEKGNLTLRATHYEYLNDTTECKLLNEYHNKFNSDNQTPSRLKEAYITSFSKVKIT